MTEETAMATDLEIYEHDNEDLDAEETDAAAA